MLRVLGWILAVRDSYVAAGAMNNWALAVWGFRGNVELRVRFGFGGRVKSVGFFDVLFVGWVEGKLLC